MKITASKTYSTTFMPTKKVKAERKAAKQTEARQRDLKAMRDKLASGAEGAGVPEMPPASVRLRKSLKNRTKI